MIAWIKRGALALAAALGACGEDTGIITLKEVRSAFSGDWVVSVALSGGMPVELHGLPYPGATSDEVIANLRFPNSFPTGLRFREISPDEDSRATDNRMKIFFNLSSPPDAVELCRDSRRGVVQRAGSGGFDAYVMFCTRDRFIAAAKLDARGFEPGDWQRFTRAFQVLMMDLTGPTGGDR